MHGMCIVRRYHEARSDAHEVLLLAASHRTADALECILQEGAGGTLLRPGADLFVIINTVHRDGLLQLGCEEALQGCERTLEIIQTSARDELAMEAERRALHAVIQEEIRIQDVLHLHTCFVRDQLHELVLLLALLTEQRQHIHLCIKRIAVIDLTVHMDRHIRNDEQITIDIDQLRRDALLRLNDHTTGDGKRTVEPRCAEHAAVLLDIQLHIAVIDDDLCVCLDLKNR